MISFNKFHRALQPITWTQVRLLRSANREYETEQSESPKRKVLSKKDALNFLETSTDEPKDNVVEHRSRRPPPGPTRPTSIAEQKRKLPVHGSVRSIDRESEITEENSRSRLAAAVTPWHDVPYDQQLKKKFGWGLVQMRRLSETLRSIKCPFKPTKDGLPCYVQDIQPLPTTEYYNRRTDFSIDVGVGGRLRCGLFGKSGAGAVCIPTDDVITIPPLHKAIAHHVEKFMTTGTGRRPFSSRDFTGYWRQAQVQSNAGEEQFPGQIPTAQLTFIIHPQQLPDEGIQDMVREIREYFVFGDGKDLPITSFYVQACAHSSCSGDVANYYHIERDDDLFTSVLGVQLKLRPNSYLLPHIEAVEAVCRAAADLVQPTQHTTLLDIYTGTGLFSILMSQHMRKVIALDTDMTILLNAKSNVEHNGVGDNVHVKYGSLAQVFKHMSSELHSTLDIAAVVNPTLTTHGTYALEDLRLCESVSKVIYITFKPERENWARLEPLCDGRQHVDKDITKTQPFVPTAVRIIDIAPHTTNLAAVILFERAKKTV